MLMKDHLALHTTNMEDQVHEAIWNNRIKDTQNMKVLIIVKQQRDQASNLCSLKLLRGGAMSYLYIPNPN